MSKRNTPQYDETQINHWLAWLAKNMQQHDQTVFLIENLQPSWLQTRREIGIFAFTSRFLWCAWAGFAPSLIAGLAVGVGFGLIAGSLGAAIFGLMLGYTSGLAFTMTLGLVIGLLAGIVFGLIDTYRIYNIQLPVPPVGVSNPLIFVGHILSIAFSCILISVLMGSIQGEVYFFLIFGVTFGLALGLIYTSRSTMRTSHTMIRTAEMLNWAPAAAVRSGVQGLIAGLIVSLIVGLIIVLNSGDGQAGHSLIGGLIGGLIVGLIFWLIIGPIVGLIGVLTGGFIPVIQQLKTEPNQGVWFSLRMAIQIGVFSGVTMVLLFGAISWIALDTIGFGLILGLMFGLTASMTLSMWFGGFEVVEHGILRLILWRKGYAPLNYAEFLDYVADELNFLQKVGGGYIFIHRYLLEYFASMADEPVAQAEEVAQTVTARDD